MTIKDSIVPHRLLSLLIVIVAILQSGCVWPFNQFYNRSVNDAPIVFTESPTREQIIQTVNANSERIHSLETQVKVTVDGLPGITGNLALEKPRNFRLQASLLGVSGTGADVGSNDELFWVWVKTTMPGQSPQILYARHAEYAVSPARQLMPIDPMWIRDALGLTEFDPQLVHEGPYRRSDGQLEMRTQLPTPLGPQTRITAIDPKYGWVTEQVLLDGQGSPVVIAKSSRHRYYQEVGVSLPQRVAIQVAPSTPQAQTLTVDAQSYSINRISGDPAMLWAMPQPPGVPLVDLAAPVPGMYPPSQSPAPSQPTGYGPGYPANQLGAPFNSSTSTGQIDPYQTYDQGGGGVTHPSTYPTMDPRAAPSMTGSSNDNLTARAEQLRGNSTPNYRGRLLR